MAALQVRGCDGRPREGVRLLCPVTPSALARPDEMQPNIVIAQRDEQRRQTLISEMVPTLRRFNPTMPADQLLELVASMADLRLVHAEVW